MPTQAAWLPPQVQGCPPCQQAWVGETWVLAQLVEAPQIVAAQSIVWSAIQTQITAEEAERSDSRRAFRTLSGVLPVLPVRCQPPALEYQCL